MVLVHGSEVGENNQMEGVVSDDCDVRAQKAKETSQRHTDSSCESGGLLRRGVW